MLPIDRLPPELLAHILSFLGEELERSARLGHSPDYSPLLSASLVARSWTRSSQEQLFSTVQLSAPDLRSVARWNSCPTRAYKTHVLVLDGFTSPVEDSDVTASAQRCNGLRTLSYFGHSCNLARLLSLSTLGDLQHLSLNDYSAWEGPSPRTVPFNNLRTLKLLAGDYPTSLLDVLFAATPNLDDFGASSGFTYNPRVVTYFGGIAPRLKRLEISHAAPSRRLLPSLTTCTALATLFCDGVFLQRQPELTVKVLNSLPTGVLRNLELGKPSANWIEQRIAVLLTMLEEYQSLKNIVRITFVEPWSLHERQRLEPFAAACEKRGIAVVWAAPVEL